VNEQPPDRGSAYRKPSCYQGDGRFTHVAPHLSRPAILTGERTSDAKLAHPVAFILRRRARIAPQHSGLQLLCQLSSSTSTFSTNLYRQISTSVVFAARSV
jgi:hypothetical protein